MEIEFKNRVSNRQPIYEMNKKEIDWIKENSIHLKSYFRKFIPHKFNGIWETEYEIDYVGKNIKQQFVKQKSKSNKKSFRLIKLRNNLLQLQVR